MFEQLKSNNNVLWYILFFLFADIPFRIVGGLVAECLGWSHNTGLGIAGDEMKLAFAQGLTK